MTRRSTETSRGSVWMVLVAVSVLWTGAASTRAEEYSDAFPSAEVREYFFADESGFVYRGGIAMRDPFGLRARTFQLADLHLAGPRNTCSMNGLWADYAALFQLEVIQDLFIGLIGNIAEAAIWAAFCATEPVLCDIVKHMRAMARANLGARLAQCHTVENAAARYGRNIWEESHKQCLDEKKAQGLSIDDAMEACGAHTLPLLDYLGKKVEHFELVNAALTTVGASDETKQLAKDVLGEVTFSADGTTTRTGHAPGRVAALYEKMAEEKESEVIEILNRVHETGAVTEADLLALSTPSLPMTPRVLLQLGRLQDGSRQVAALRLARALAMDRLMTKVKALQEQLEAARKTPGGEAKAAALLVEKRDLEQQMHDLARYKELHEKFVAQPLLEVMREVAIEEETTASQVKPGGAADRSLRGAQALQHRVGAFGDVGDLDTESNGL